jgi:hypothetical protein
LRIADATEPDEDDGLEAAFGLVIGTERVNTVAQPSLYNNGDAPRDKDDLRSGSSGPVLVVSPNSPSEGTSPE